MSLNSLPVAVADSFVCFCDVMYFSCGKSVSLLRLNKTCDNPYLRHRKTWHYSNVQIKWEIIDEIIPNSIVTHVTTQVENSLHNGFSPRIPVHHTWHWLSEEPCALCKKSFSEILIKVPMWFNRQDRNPWRNKMVVSPICTIKLNFFLHIQRCVWKHGPLAVCSFFFFFSALFISCRGYQVTGNNCILRHCPYELLEPCVCTNERVSCRYLTPKVSLLRWISVLICFPLLYVV